MAAKDITWFSRSGEEPINNDIKAGGWQELGEDQAGGRVLACEYADKTFHVNGASFSGSATVTMRGSCKQDPDPDTPTDWFTLHAANDGSETTLLGDQYGATILENPLWLSPLVVDGDGSTSVNVDITLKKGT